MQARIDHDTYLAVEEAIRRIDAAGLPVTEQLLMAYVTDIALPRLEKDFVRDYLSGKIVPGSRKQLQRGL